MFIPQTDNELDPVIIVLSCEEAARIIQTLAPLFPVWQTEGQRTVYHLVSKLKYATPRIALMQCEPDAVV